MNTDLNEPSCSCSSSAMSGGGGGLGLSQSMISAQRRQQDLALFYQMLDEGASTQELAMGLYLLEKTWGHTAAADEDWLTIEEDLLSEISGLAAEARKLDARIRSFELKSRS